MVGNFEPTCPIALYARKNNMTIERTDKPILARSGVINEYIGTSTEVNMIFPEKLKNTLLHVCNRCCGLCNPSILNFVSNGEDKILITADNSKTANLIFSNT